MRVSSSALAIAVSLGIAAAGRTAGPKVYVNSEWRLSVDIPARASTCGSTPPEHDHGIDIFLDSGPDGCDSLETRPYIGAGAGYNAAFEASAEDALGDICHLYGSTRAAAPPGLAIAGLRSASCRANSADGSWITIYVAAQAGDLGEKADVNYNANLHTTPKRFEADLARFRLFLRDSLRVE